ncbi:MAG: phosphoenolpyruvate--protein phosphotransferase [Oscillospiraceae bacterium]|nr:phosphoenolpyruvate--protein phosphotransferase [Oscillospiraceae bacterium]
MKALGTSPGIGIGSAYIVRHSEVAANDTKVNDSEKEIERLSMALEKGVSELIQLQEELKGKADGKASDIFFAHQMILEDSEIIGRITEMIRNEKVGAAFAVKTVSSEFARDFESKNNSYLRERAVDIRDAADRLLKILNGVNDVTPESFPEKAIVFAEELTPKETVLLDKEKIMGIVTEKGGATSHVAILAKAMGIPAVTGAEGILDLVSANDDIVIDGYEGSVYINPEDAIKLKYREKLAHIKSNAEKLKERPFTSVITVDGYRVMLEANAGGINDLLAAEKNGCDGIGLFRTEFLFLGAEKMPSEDEQFEVYRQAAEKMKGKKTVFRTLDVGGDKIIPYFNLPKEDNPFLGFRAIRFCLSEKQVFKTQLRALLRASAFGNVNIMFPMISAVEELRAARGTLEQVKRQLTEEKKPFNDEIKVGIMIEIPSAAIISDILAKESDFFSIGTNDLIQYTLAADRLNSNVGYLYSPYNPAVLRLVKLVIDNAHKCGIPVAMCGEAASEPELIPLLIGMGLDEFSVSSACLPAAREAIEKSSKQCLSDIVENALYQASTEEVRHYLGNVYSII